MEFTYSFTASAEDVFEKISDPQFIVDRCMELGSLDASCDSDGKELPTLTITRTQEMELAPIMKKVVGKQQIMETTETWSETDESYDSQSHTRVKGTPISIDATQCLYNTEDGSEISVTVNVKAKIPLLTSKVEPMVATRVRKEMLSEFDYVEAALNG